MADFPTSQIEFESWFSTEDKCVDFFIKNRWPKGFSCPHCQCGTYWKTGRRLICASCRKDIHYLAGTIFQDTHLPLMIWYRAMWYIVSQKYGTNALGLQRVLGVTTTTAWHLLHKLRRAMVRPGRELLKGTVEVDETYVGGIRPGKPGRGAADKSIVVLGVEKQDKSLGKVRMRIIPSASAEALVGFICDNIEPGSTLITDKWKGYSDELLKVGNYIHVIAPKKVGKTDDTLPGVHRVISLIKRWLLSTYQGATSHRQLEYYLDEYAFRFNRKISSTRGQLFQRLIENAVIMTPTKWVEIKQSDSSEE